MQGEQAVKAALPKSHASFLTLRRILMVTGLLLSGAVAWMLLWTGDAYRQFAVETLNNSVSGTVNFFVGSRIGQDYADRIGPIANEWSRTTSLVKSVQDQDSSRMVAELNILSNASQVVQGEVRLLDSILYDIELNRLAGSDARLGASITDDAGLLETLKARSQADARKAVSYVWALPDGRPVFSMIVPVGGFRVAGYLEIITDPLPMLQGIGAVLGGDFRIVAGDGAILFESLEHGEQTPDAAPAPDTGMQRSSLNVAIEDGRGGVWAHATFDRDITDFYTQTDELRTLSIQILVSVLAVGWIAAGLLLKFTVFRQLRGFAHAMKTIAGGDTSVRLPIVGKDEIGDMRKALVGLRESVRQAMILQNMVEHTPTMTALITPDGDLGYLNAAAKSYVGDAPHGSGAGFLDLGDAFNRKVAQSSNLPFTDVVHNGKDHLEILAAPVRDNKDELLGTMLAWNLVTQREESRMAVQDMMTEVEHVARAVTQQSDSLLELASNLTRQSEATIGQSGNALNISQEAAGNTQNVATAVEELSSSIAEINRQAGDASNVTERARSEAEESQRNIISLEKASSQIGSIIDLINDIAHRTKMLSLNATIEAERAGELGRGFAVVANEVKSLADQTASATGQIGTLTGAIQQEVQKAAKSISTVGDVIHQVNDIQMTITQSVDEQRRATSEISDNVQRIAQGAGSMDEMMRFVNDGAQSTGKTAHDLNSASHELSQMAKTLSDRMEAFSTRMKIA
ncbi:methyl-accepting chemotaxis protein [Thalassospira sp.]|uniref:methyl-accepting chemotaxis protein n=1 Tax=Thalassospira sp. TaxID=1912094 RepID=UPI0027340CC0|nr:HAMP domain-containing methyl-accepting chemotaxis protein [Thalassospira sp.]MDP2698753.1 HAMP domain-containing methyl-accepting chemotaxis protein [Thalassospira sp.]